MPEVFGPRQTILVTCREELEFMGKIKEVHNIITVAWHMPVSFDPLMYAIAIGKTRASLEIIKKSKAFVVNFIPYELKEAALTCGKLSGRHHNKFVEAKLTMEESNHIDCPKIKEAIGYLECHVVEEIEAGDHVIFVAEVTQQQLKEDKHRLFHCGGDKFKTTE
jgi:flavin reductase (DIM6/NTAB) family NADH-FMN oxidoreductase RutF